MIGLKAGVIKALLLFVTATALIQVFYIVTANLNLFADGRYFPYGYAVHILYYFGLFLVVFLFAGKSDFSAIGLKRMLAWKKYILTGVLFGLLFQAMRVIAVQGTFSRSYSLPLEFYVPAYILLALLIGLAEESAFRGFILGKFLESYKPILAILVTSFLFGIYHVDFSNFDFSWWTWYVMQAFTGGLIMSILYYKTGRNLIAPITYHATNIILVNTFPWTALVSGQYLLTVQSIINLGLAAILVFLPVGALKSTSVSEVK